jgi:hypothetical protein
MRKKVISHCPSQVKAMEKAWLMLLTQFCRQKDESALSLSFSLAWLPITLLHFLISPRGKDFGRILLNFTVIQVTQFKEGTVITSH